MGRNPQEDAYRKVADSPRRSDVRYRKKPNSISRMITEIGTPSNQRRIGIGFGPVFGSVTGPANQVISG